MAPKEFTQKKIIRAIASNLTEYRSKFQNDLIAKYSILDQEWFRILKSIKKHSID